MCFRTILSVLAMCVAALCAFEMRASSDESEPSDLRIVEGDRMPVVIKSVGPVYPPDLKRKGVQGQVTVEFIVDRAGNVAEAFVIDASKSAPWQFQYSAVVAIWQWKFRPGLKNGKPVRARMQLPIKFELIDD
jgi:protein TonB